MPQISEFWNIWPQGCKIGMVNLYYQPSSQRRNWDSSRGSGLPKATQWAGWSPLWGWQLPSESKLLGTMGGCSKPWLQPGKSAVSARLFSVTGCLRNWGNKGVENTNQNGSNSEGLVLTLPRTVRHGFGSSSGCSSFTTPTQPYSYKSSSSLLLHRPSGCI